jgi:phosphoglycerol transferase MdoB-like AlkP superfamily enzyme
VNDSPAETVTPSPPPDTPAAPTGRTRSRQLVIVASTAVVTLVWALLVTMVLNASNFPSPLTALRERALDAPTTWESVALVWVIVLLVLALTGRLWVSLGIVTALTALVGAVNATKLELRNDPVYPSDVTFLRQPGFLFEMVSTSKLVLGAVGLVALVVLAALFGWLVAKLLPNLGRTLSRRGQLALRVVRVVAVITCLVLLHLANNFNEPDNPWRAAFDATGLRWRDWDQRINYQRNGFVAGMLFNTHITAMSEPSGYSRAAVEKIAEKYAAQAAALNKNRAGSLAKTNVVTILSESFSNPNWLKTVKFSPDPIPRTTALMKQTMSGKLLTPGYGSGTANVEFEVLTGQSKSQLRPQVATAYEQMVQHHKTFPSAVDWFLAHGHTPIAIHPFSPRMYARPEVYQAFGFKKFITKDEMTSKARGGGRFIDDEAAFDEVLTQIKSHQTPLLAHLVTMQNHMPYGGQYDDPIPPTGLPGNFSALAGQYGRGIERTDRELAAFLDKLKQQPEPTAVVFYGDHLPPQVYPESLVKREGLRTTHETPFIIWSNGTPLKHTELPTTSPIQLLPKLFDALDVPIPPWFALLDDLDKQIPAMDAGLYVDAQNKTVKDEEKLTPAASQALSDYRLIMYDLSIGKRYSEKTMYADTPAG